MLKGILADHSCRQPFDRRGNARSAKSLVEFAPAGDAVFGHDLDEVVVSPAGVAGQRLDTSNGALLGHDFPPGLVLR
jgi:hypothetical protein